MCPIISLLRRLAIYSRTGYACAARRLIVHRPHLGTSYHFIELLKILDTLFGLMDLLTVQQNRRSLSLLLVVSRVVLQPTFFRNPHRFAWAPPRIKH